MQTNDEGVVDDLESDLKRKLKIEAGKHGGQKRVGVRVRRIRTCQTCEMFSKVEIWPDLIDLIEWCISGV